MSENSSSSSNDSVLHPPDSSTFSLGIYCLTTRPSSYLFIVFTITCILVLLPLCILILHHGLQQWQKKRSTSSAVSVSHSDVFTYHLVPMELLVVCACVLTTFSVLKEDLNSLRKVGFLFAFTWFGETCFHSLTCVERYLAVVHPITYMNLKTERGIRIRNISITCVWLLCFIRMSVHETKEVKASDIFVLILSLIIVSFCSLSVLCVLIRPGPGERGGDRERVDQSKLRAFYTITIILGFLLLRCCCDMAWAIGVEYLLLRSCVFPLFQVWLNLPGTLVLPLLFLQRAGKLEYCKKNIQQG